MSFDFSLAQPGDDEEIRRLLRQTPMPGNPTLTLEREPDYFRGCETMGFPYQVLLARTRANGELAGMVYRSVSTRYVNGAREQVGYIGQARILPRYQGTMLPLRILPVLRELDQQYPVSRYFTVIAEKNIPARKIFSERARPSIPRLIPLGRMCTLSIILRYPPPAVIPGLRQAKTADIEELLLLLNDAGSCKQLYPRYTRADLLGFGYTRDLSCTRFFIIEKEGKIGAAAALWDQSGYKQTRITAYHGWLAGLKTVYNRVNVLWGAPALPEPGGMLHSVYAAGVAVCAVELFAGLLTGLYTQAQQRGYAYLLLQFCDRDPLLKTARRFAHIRYNSLVYTFSFQDPSGDLSPSFQPPDGRIPYVEAATL